jgi:N-acetylneuraminate lyase
LEAARTEQFRVVRLVKLFSSFGYMAAAKATMERIGVPVGPPRLPNNRLSPDQTTRLLEELDRMGFFDWIR